MDLGRACFWLVEQQSEMYIQSRKRRVEKSRKKREEREEVEALD
jgi:hypothetical protein